MKKIVYLLALVVCFFAFSCNGILPFKSARVNDSVSPEDVALFDVSDLKTSSVYFSSTEPFEISVDNLNFDGKLLSLNTSSTKDVKNIDVCFDELDKGEWVKAEKICGDGKYYVFLRGKDNTTLTNGDISSSFNARLLSSKPSKAITTDTNIEDLTVLNIGGNMLSLLDYTSDDNAKKNKSADAFMGIFEQLSAPDFWISSTDVNNISFGELYNLNEDAMRLNYLGGYNAKADTLLLYGDGTSAYLFDNVSESNLTLVKETRTKRYYEIDTANIIFSTSGNITSAKAVFSTDNSLDILYTLDAVADTHFRGGLFETNGEHWWTRIDNIDHNKVTYFTDPDFLSTYSMNLLGKDFNPRLAWYFDLNRLYNFDDHLQPLYPGYILPMATYTLPNCDLRLYRHAQYPWDFQSRTRELMMEANKKNSVYFVSDEPFSISIKSANALSDGIIYYTSPYAEKGGFYIPEEWDGSEISATKFGVEDGYYRFMKNYDYYPDPAENPAIYSGDNKYYLFLRGEGNTAFDSGAVLNIKSTSTVYMSDNFENLLDYKTATKDDANYDNVLSWIWNATINHLVDKKIVIINEN